MQTTGAMHSVVMARGYAFHAGHDQLTNKCCNLKEVK